MCCGNFGRDGFGDKDAPTHFFWFRYTMMMGTALLYDMYESLWSLVGQPYVQQEHYDLQEE